MKKSIHTIESFTLCQLLVEYRKASKISQRELARRLKWNQAHLSAVEIGNRRLDLLEFKIIAKALGIDIGKFFKELESRIEENRKLYPDKPTMD